jgi:hypothetical protein
MESFFSRLGRFEIGTHHHIAGPYLLNYAAVAIQNDLGRPTLTRHADGETRHLN